jgi:hypothetical protein
VNSLASRERRNGDQQLLNHAVVLSNSKQRQVDRSEEGAGRFSVCFCQTEKSLLRDGAALYETGARSLKESVLGRFGKMVFQYVWVAAGV